MYPSSSFVSITDVRKNFSSIIDILKEEKQKVIFRNNKPTAVLLDFNFYEKLQQLNKDNNIIVEELEWSEEFIWTPQHKELLSLMKSA